MCLYYTLWLCMLVACTEMMRLLCSATQKKTKEDFDTAQQVNITVIT